MWLYVTADVTAELHFAKWNVMVTTGDEQEGIWKEGPQLVPLYYPRHSPRNFGVRTQYLTRVKSDSLPVWNPAQ